MKKINISILFGENEVKHYENTNNIENLKDNISKFSFDNEKEKNAFLLGMNTALGWQAFIIIDDLSN